MRPTPSYLTGKVKLIKQENETDSIFHASLICDACSTDFFELKAIDSYKDRNKKKKVLCVLAKEGNSYFNLEAVCKKCAKNHLLFDFHNHGWHGWVCHDPEHDKLPKLELINWLCNFCKHEKFKIELIICGHDKKDFIEETEGKFETEKWQDAFMEFNLFVNCENCSKKEHIVNLST